MPKNSKIPDRWLDYRAYGKVVAGTNIVAFKVPLKYRTLASRSNERHTTEDIVRKIPRLGMVIALTNTLKYYEIDDWHRHGIESKWIKTEGHIVPRDNLLIEFCQTVHDFTQRHPDKLVGVHCTHGLNRTGYFVCSYMVLCNRVTPLAAIRNFEVARGHQIERENYVDAIMSNNRNNFLLKKLEHLDRKCRNKDESRSDKFNWVHKDAK